MSVKSHFFTHNPPQNQHGKNTPEAAQATKIPLPQDTSTVVTELQEIRETILENLATDLSGVKKKE